MLTKAVYGAVARSAGRAAAQRQLAGGGIDDRSGDPLDAYLQDLASWVEQRGYSIDSRRCLWCGKATKLKTGTLPYVGALWYCPSCADTYRTCKDRQARIVTEEQEPEAKTHYRDAWGASSCGVGHLTTANPARVTCRRCLAYHIASGVPIGVLRFLR
jgi:hypothetical protein